ncbi:hypothetical protein FXN61_00605 [Lentzea sp. PSKA42]|uniref:Uncharacterized protein n=1 Tax=Lentzea indica TaxID=2604800 RepID=A0ABX1F999_9PSEU|nr:hypothetical protein [Lentzea indica]NKE55407.1 hypothetical protein [Lentzea indica]
MPVVLRLDRGEIDALITWLRGQLAADRQGRAHAAILDELARHLHAEAAAGQLARRVLQLLGSIYEKRPGYRSEWRP